MDKVDLKFHSLRLRNPDSDSFSLSLGITLDNTKTGLKGRLGGMLADIRTRRMAEEKGSKYKRGLPRFVHPDDTANLARRDVPAPYYNAYLHRVQMPAIDFGGDKAKVINIPESKVFKNTKEWGDLLARLFRREQNIALNLEGTGEFNSGGLKVNIHMQKNIPMGSPGFHIPNGTRLGIIEWDLGYDKVNGVATLSGVSQFAILMNVTVFLVRILILIFLHIYNLGQTNKSREMLRLTSSTEKLSLEP